MFLVRYHSGFMVALAEVIRVSFNLFNYPNFGVVVKEGA